MLAQPSNEEGRELEQDLTQLLLLRLNRYAFEQKLITQEVYHKINIQLHSCELA